MWETWFRPLGWEDPLEKGKATLSSVLAWRIPCGLPGGSDGKESACKAGDLGSIPGSGKSPGEGQGNPLHYSCWEIPGREEPGGL